MDTSDAAGGAAEVLAAITSGDLERLKGLLAADPSLAAARDGAGLSAVMHARYRFRLDMLSLLLAPDPRLDIFEAAAVGRDDLVASVLAEDPARARAWSADGGTALHFAAFFGHPAAIKLLLAYGADFNAVAASFNNVTPLHSAVASKNGEAIELLLAAGADVNARQQAGWTPLHAVAQCGDRELALRLVALGADKSARSDDGKSPADLAREKGNHELAALLEVPGADVS